MKHDLWTAPKKGVCLKVGDTPVVVIVIYFDSPILEDLEVSYHFQTNPSAALQPWKLFKLPGRFVPFRLLLKHSPNVKLCSCGHFTSSKDRSKSFPKVKLRRLLGNGTWPCYDPGYAMIASCHL